MSLMYLGATTLLLIILEQIPRLRYRNSSVFRRYFASDVVYMLTSYVALASVSVTFIVVGASFVGSTLGLPGLSALHLPIWISLPLALVALDFGQYLAHYLMHRYDWLWEFHKVHHSSLNVDLLATFRSHLVEQALRRIVGPLGLIMAGFPLNASLIASGIFIAWAEFNHANLRVNLGILETVLISPRLHKMHHVPRTSENNLGTIFTFWDGIRGTLIRVPTTPSINYGNGERDYPQTWSKQLVTPIIRIAQLYFATNGVSGTEDRAR